MDKKLTPKQKAFADYYIENGGNATQAAIKAGYSKKYANTNANKLLQNTTISKYIEERNKIIESERIASITEVKEYWTRVMRGEEKDQFGLDASLQDRNKAAESLAKTYGMFINKIESDNKINVSSTKKLDSILEQMGGTE
ncbi:terminase small subunit [Clostridium nigeriense]|uniref:terminase small subunit n=1 Tax=Clostridium nigeriense TaxID=1805470 RepID=UPI003D354E03